MKVVQLKRFLGVFVLLGAVCGSGTAFGADNAGTGGNAILDQCQYLPLATNLTAPAKFGARNTSVCVDIPVEVHQAKMVFNMDTDTVDGKGNSNGLKHMVMMGNVMKDQIRQGLIKPEDVSIIGILHGSALKWATKSVPAQQKKLIDAIFKLKQEGVNLQLEVCAAAMNGAGLTKKDLYTYDAEGRPEPKFGSRIYVNQGAFARELYLENQGYAYFEEGYELHAKK